jgi:4-hydroxymandelate oxidase
MRARETTLRESRRALLRFLLGSPILLAGRPARALEDLLRVVSDCAPGLADAVEVIASPADAINVFDFRAAAEERLSPAHWAYLTTGVDHEVGLRANRAGFAKFGLRPRRLIDVRDLDTRTTVLGEKLTCPIALAPAGAQRAFHVEGELAVARAAKAQDHLQILSTGSSAPFEEVAKARGAPIWLQLYTPHAWPLTRWQLGQAEDAGCPVVVLTVDLPGFGSQDRLRRFRGPGYPFRSKDDPACYSCHSGRVWGPALRLLDRLGVDPRELASDAFTLDWDYVDRIRDATSMKLVLKGILTHEDARLSVEHGIDGIIVSNHGARQMDNALSTIEVLPEISHAVDGRIPILIDSGFRRGTDFFTALALGADAVCIGRPYLWGLAAFGQEGVEAVLAIVRAEFEAVMRQMGARDIASISGAFVQSMTPEAPSTP